MMKIKIKDLVSHKENSFFFDDIEGDAWQEFLNSVKTSGIIEPIVVTQNKVIVSGHQRVRACKTLGIEEIEAEVRIIDSEDEVLKQLIETNIRQRGIGNTNPVKFGLCLKELDRIYGVFRGNHTDENQNNFGSKTQEQIASEIGISAETYRNYEKLAEAIPEIQTLIETGIVTPTTARAIMKKLPEFQQKELAGQLLQSGKKTTGKEVDAEIKKLKEELRDVKEERDYLESKLEEAQEYQQKEKEILVQEVPPKDYQEIKDNLKMYKTQAKSAEAARIDVVKQLEEAQKRIKDLEERKDLTEMQKKLEEEAGYFAVRTYDYIQKNGGFVWITERLEQLPDDKRKEFVDTVYAIDAFAKQMVENIGGYAVEQ